MKNKITQFFLLILMLVFLSGYDLSADVLIDESFLEKINSDNVSSCSITEDNSFFVFSKSNKKGYGSLYCTEYKNGKWDDVKALTDLNSDFDDVSPYISPDGKFILFSSNRLVSSNRSGSLKNRAGNRQSYDIFYSERKGKDWWSEPVPLYGAVNTRYDELNPFISKDGGTLYFTRVIDDDDSLKTIVVKVKKVGDSWEEVQTAEISQNLNVDILAYREAKYRSGAYVIARKKDNPGLMGIFYTDNAHGNTLKQICETSCMKEDEISVAELNKDKIIVASNLNGEYKFFIRDVNFTADADINVNTEIIGENDDANIKERWKLASNIVSLKIVSDYYTDKSKIKIQVLHFTSLQKDSLPIKSEILSSDKSGMLDVHIDSAIQRILVIPGASGMKAFVYEIFTTRGITPDTTIIKVEHSSEKEFIAKPIFFKFNSADIEIADIPYIHQLIDLLRADENLNLDLNGYSDGIGSYKANMELSIKRAEKVRSYLVKFGIKAHRIKAEGFGHLKSSKNDTFQYNRRVDIILK